jgi:hypothetical protein
MTGDSTREWAAWVNGEIASGLDGLATEMGKVLATVRKRDRAELTLRFEAELAPLLARIADLELDAVKAKAKEEAASEIERRLDLALAPLRARCAELEAKAPTPRAATIPAKPRPPLALPPPAPAGDA